MIKAVDFGQNSDSRNIIVKATPADLCYWYVTPERH